MIVFIGHEDTTFVPLGLQDVIIDNAAVISKSLFNFNAFEKLLSVSIFINCPLLLVDALKT